MSLFDELWRVDAGRNASDEGKFTLSQLHYDRLKPDQKRDVYALASALSKLWGGMTGSKSSPAVAKNSEIPKTPPST